MKRVFADSFFYIALLSRNDVDRVRAVDASKRLRAHIFTTPWVLTEVADAMSAPPHRNLFLRLHERLQHNPNVTIVPAAEGLFQRALKLYSQRPDQDWPLTDCVSFVVMQEFGIDAALTADRHFEQAGFVALLRL